MPSEAYLKRKADYIRNYQHQNYKLVAIRFRRGTDDDAIAAMVGSGNASEFCKRAIRYYIENGGK